MKGKGASYSSNLRGTKLFFFYCTSIITSQIQEEAKWTDAAGKYNTKLTLLSIYKDCLGAFMSREKQVFARGGTINDRFRFSRDVRSTKKKVTEEENGDSILYSKPVSPS